MANKRTKSFELSPEKKKEITKAVLALVTVFAVSVLLLSGIYILLENKIEETERLPFLSAMTRICPADRYEEVDYEFSEAGKVYNMHKAYQGEELTGYCVEVHASDSEGDIRVAVAAGADGRILHVEIISQGSVRSNGTKSQDEEFLSQFVSKGGEITLAKTTAADSSQVREVPGMTLSPQTICDAVNRASLAVGHLRKNEEKEITAQ